MVKEQQCQGKTSAGKRCTRKVTSGKFCWQHGGKPKPKIAKKPTLRGGIGLYSNNPSPTTPGSSGGGRYPHSMEVSPVSSANSSASRN